MNKIKHYAGTNYEIGRAIGRQFGARYPKHLESYLNAMEYQYGINRFNLEQDCMLWFEALPYQYQEEFLGISEGAGCPIEMVAKFSYADRCIAGGCTSFICNVEGNAWIGRNNDYLSLDSWGYVNFIAVNNKIPFMLFGMEGDNFSGTGMNKNQIWMHYNWLPVWDSTTFSERPLPPYVFLRHALETCNSLAEIEYLLKTTVRDGGMSLFAVDGKNNEYSVFECTCRDYVKRNNKGIFITGANNFNAIIPPAGVVYDFSRSEARQLVVEAMLQHRKSNVLPDSFIDILSNPEVEQNNGASGTVYSVVCCPAREEIWYAHDGFPAASKGVWDKIDCNW